LIHVAKDPVFTGFEGLHQRVFGGVKVLGRMLILARVAATHVAAHEALPEVHPGIADSQAILATLSRGLHVVDLVEVRAVRCHADVPPFGG
jgi:hypothetical protein